MSSKADILEQMHNSAPAPKLDHEFFHATAMRGVIDTIRHFEQLRDKTAKEDTPEARGEYNAACVSLGKAMALTLGLTVGMSEYSKREVRLLISMMVVFLKDLVGEDILPVKEDLEFAKVICDSLDHAGGVN